MGIHRETPASGRAAAGCASRMSRQRQLDAGGDDKRESGRALQNRKKGHRSNLPENFQKSISYGSNPKLHFSTHTSMTVMPPACFYEPVQATDQEAN
jgi:hypothetical protein